MATRHLLNEFPPISTQTWEEIILKDLKGADYAKKLIWRTDEGLAVKPYYRAEDIEHIEHLDAAPGDFPYVRGTRAEGDWSICEEIDAVDPEDANRAACDAVVAGAEKIIFRNATIGNTSDLRMALANLREIPVHFGNADESLLRLLLQSPMERPVSATISTGCSPFSNLDFAAEIARNCGPQLVPFHIHGEEFEESGATAVEDVGFTLAAAVDYLGEMQCREVEIDRAAGSVGFSFATGSNFFFEIAKLRAFRMIWARIVEVFGGAPGSAKARIHARTSRWNKTIYDPHVNILRGTTEAMSAIFGGADSISVAPFDESYKVPDEASRRLARNTQILLKEEALLARVADPGGGSYYLEFLTDFVGRESWKRMQEIESAGGFRRFRESGNLAHALEQSMAARERAVISRRRVFTGTNKFAEPSERALERIDPSRSGLDRRGTAEYERLRLRTERHVAKGGMCPRVVLAEIGDEKMRTARSGFAASFFCSAGFDIRVQQFSRVNEIADVESELVVLCSSDSEYLEFVEELLSKMKAKDRRIPIVIAGDPDTREQLKALGVPNFVHIRSNPIEVLSNWQQRLGIKE